MPNSRNRQHRLPPTSGRSTSAARALDAADAAEAPVGPVDRVRGIADALCRAADECCHQHGRSASLTAAAPLAAEADAAGRICAVCDDTLEQLAAAYEQTAARVRPEGDPGWWRRANALWLAAREYAHRRRSCDRASRSTASKHAPEQLEALQLEFELEASALLALRQAAEAYCTERPRALIHSRRH